MDDETTIGLDETLLAFAHRRYGAPLHFNFDEHTSYNGRQCECIRDNGGLKITFLRTTRMPDDALQRKVLRQRPSRQDGPRGRRLHAHVGEGGNVDEL